MKKILCLIDSLGLGGAERQMVGLAVLLKERGYQVDLVTYHVDDSYGHIAQQGGCVPIVLSVKNSPLSKFLAVFRFIKKNGGYDSVITFKSGPNAIGCLLKAIGVKTQVIVSERSFTKTLNRRSKVLFNLYRFADYVVPNSYSQAKYIKRHYKSLSSKTITITNFTDSNIFTPSTVVPMEADKVTIMTAARITKAKNIINYLKAIKLLKQQNNTKLHFDWYGDVHKGEEEYGDNVFKTVQDLGIGDMVTFHPATANIIEHYQNCDIFCLSSIYEGFPNVICEAMCCGKPVVCSNVCDNPYIVKEGENAILFDPTNVSDIANKIRDISSLAPNQRKEMGERSREIALQMFSTRTFTEKYISLIES